MPRKKPALKIDTGKVTQGPLFRTRLFREIERRDHPTAVWINEGMVLLEESTFVLTPNGVEVFSNQPVIGVERVTSQAMYDLVAPFLKALPRFEELRKRLESSEKT